MSSTLLAPSPVPGLQVRRLSGASLRDRLPSLTDYMNRRETLPLGQRPKWLNVLQGGLQQSAYALEAVEGDEIRGYLPLVFVSSLLFGRFLVSLPYLNSNGVAADDAEAAGLLVDEAVRLADDLRVRHLELRHEGPIDHPALTGRMESKVHMRMKLPDFPGPLWSGLSSNVRSQVRKGEKSGLTVHWGGEERLEEFYAVFSRNMRDLGTPVYGRALFRRALQTFPGEAELCIVRSGDVPVAGAFLLHGKGVTEVPSASCLRAYNPVCANMMMYWNLLNRSVERGQQVFDFGRCTRDSGTFRFKRQWGAKPEPAVWQYYQRTGHGFSEMRPESPRYQRLIRLWQRLPVAVTRMIGPLIVRGIP